MSVYAHIKRCLELSDRDIASALGERHLVKALLDQLSKVGRPGDGAPKLLIVFARMATGSADWVDGALRVELAGDSGATNVEVLSELGLGMRERVFPTFKLAVPLDEFIRAVERVPHMIAPLTISTVSETRLVLTAVTDGDEASDGDAVPLAPVSIGDDSLYTAERHRPSKAPSEAPKPSRKSSRPKADSARPKANAKSVRPAAPPPARAAQQAVPPPPTRATGAHAAPRIAPPAVVPRVPRAPPLPRTDDRTSEPKGAIVARVPLAKVQVVKAAPTPPRGSKPPKRPSEKPEAPKQASKAPPRNTKAPPKPRMSDPPNAEAIDSGWDDN
jgi:hypothetical protein